MNPTIEEHTDAMTGRTEGTMDEQQATTTLLPSDFSQDLRRRWDQVQTSFVDDPRTAVKQADDLVGSAIDRLQQVFEEQRKNLEGQWDRGSDVSTEDMRQALRKYRAFFQRLLMV